MSRKHGKMKKGAGKKGKKELGAKMRNFLDGLI